MVLVEEIQSKTVFTAKKEDTVLDASLILTKKGISCLIIIENDNIIGIITNRDIIEKVVSRQINPANIDVGSVMSSPVKTITSEKNIFYASTIMNSSKIKQIPVVNDAEELMGVVTQTDIMRCIADLIF